MKRRNQFGNVRHHAVIVAIERAFKVVHIHGEGAAFASQRGDIVRFSNKFIEANLPKT
jgi:hypothetical protein